MSAAPDWTIRPYADADAAAVAGLVDADNDPLFVLQASGLHGPPLTGDRFRRTLVAEWNGTVVGAGTIAGNRVHPGRYSLAVEVAAACRRRGIGRGLVEAARAIRAEPIVMAAKVRPTDAAAIALLKRIGGRIYQRCPGVVVDPAAAEVTAWCAAQVPPAGTHVAPLGDLTAAERTDLWVRQYLWVHADWSPAEPAALRELTPGIVADAAPELGTVVRRGDDLVAVAWTFREDDGRASVVCEATGRAVPDGVAAVAAALAGCLENLRRDSIGEAELDGHVSDPHLAPVLGTLPAVASRPLLLVEV